MQSRTDIYDYWFALAAITEKQYTRLVKLLSPSSLDDNKIFATNSERVRNRDQLISILGRLFIKQSRKHWLNLLADSNVPSAPINNIDEVFDMELVKERNSVWNVSHPSIGQLPLLANALQHVSTNPVSPKSSPPLLGQHTDELLRNFVMLSEQEIKSLEKEGSILSAKNDFGDSVHI